MVLREMLAAGEPGMTTRELDSLGERLLARHGARSAPRLTHGFPGSTCTSINAGAAHGVPGDRVIRAGDVLNVDVAAELGGDFDPADRRVLRGGMVITIEPFLSTRSRVVTETSDGWTLVGAPGNLSAQ